MLFKALWVNIKYTNIKSKRNFCASKMSQWIKAFAPYLDNLV